MNDPGRSHFTVILLACAMALALALVACGGDGASTSLEATVRDFEFEPTSWTVVAGEEITLEMTNEAALTHEFVILQKGVVVDDETDLPETEEELLSDFVRSMRLRAPMSGTAEHLAVITGHLRDERYGAVSAVIRPETAVIPAW